MFRKTTILLISLICVLFPGILPAAADSMADTIKANYLALKESIEADPEKDRGDFSTPDIEQVKREMGIGFNFGNSLDWAFNNGKVRRYKIRISIGYDEAEYYFFEDYVNMTGNLSDFITRSDSTKPYAELPLTPNDAYDPKPSDPINCLRISIRNKFSETSKFDVVVNVKYLRLSDKYGNNLIKEEYSKGSVQTPVNYDFLPVLNIPLETTIGEFYSEEKKIFADIQLENFISDYKNHPELVYKDTYNGEPATDEELEFLWEQGFRTIRLPVTWYAHMDSTGTVDPEWFDEVKRIVDRVLSHGFYVIVNIHHDGGRKGWIKADEFDFQQHEYLYRYLVLQIAENFKHYGSKLILAGPNEVTNYRQSPRIDSSIPDIDVFTSNVINQLFVDEVRSTGYGNTNRFLMVGTWYALPKNLEYYQLPLDTAANKLFTEVHDYLKKDKAVLRSLEFFAESDMDWLSSFNLVMSEFGIPRSKETSVKCEFMEKHVSEIYQLGIPMIVWDDGGEYALMDNQKAAWDTAWESDQVAETMLETYRNSVEGSW